MKADRGFVSCVTSVQAELLDAQLKIVPLVKMITL